MIQSLCKGTKKAVQACVNQVCDYSAFQCADSSCSCHKGHQLCSLVKLQSFITYLSKKNSNLNSILIALRQIQQQVAQLKKQLLKVQIARKIEPKFGQYLFSKQVNDATPSQIKKALTKLSQDSLEQNYMLEESKTLNLTQDVTEMVQKIVLEIKTKANSIKNISQQHSYTSKQQQQSYKQELSQALYNITKRNQIYLIASKDQFFPELTIDIIPLITTLKIQVLDLTPIKIIIKYLERLSRLSFTLGEQYVQVLEELSKHKNVNQLILNKILGRENANTHKLQTNLITILSQKFTHLKMLGFEGQINYDHRHISDIVGTMPYLEVLGLNLRAARQIEVQFLLRSFPQLKQFYINSNLGMNTLKYAKNLKALSVNHILQGQNSSLKPIQTNLEYLSVKQISFQFIKEQSGIFKSLKVLSTSGVEQLDEIAQVFATGLFENLEILCLRNFKTRRETHNLTHRNLATILDNTPNLKSLDLSQRDFNRFGDNQCVDIICQKGKQLEKLSLFGIDLNSQDIMNMQSSLKQLKQFVHSFYDDQWKDDAGSFYFSKIKKLKRIDIKYDYKLHVASVYKLMRNKREILFTQNNLFSRKAFRNASVLRRFSALTEQEAQESLYHGKFGLFDPNSMFYKRFDRYDYF